MPLAPRAELDQPLRVEIGERDRLGLGFDDAVVDARAAALDQPAGLAVRGRQTGTDEKLEGGKTARQDVARQGQLRQLAAGTARLEDLARGLGRRLRGGAAVAQRGRLGRQQLLRLIDLSIAQFFELRDLSERSEEHTSELQSLAYL